MSGDGPSARLLRTPFHAQHVAAGARMVDFGGWDMPVQYPTGIIAEHLATRGGAGLFDVSHMGRFVLRGPGSAAFLQHVLTNNAEALDLLQAQYTMVPTETGGAVDDAYLYRFVDGRVPAGRQRLQPAQGLGPLPRPPRALPRRRDDRRDRRDRDGGPAGQDVAGHPRAA